MNRLLLICILYPMLVVGQCWNVVDVGRNHVVAIGDNGSLWAWGNNEFNKLGYNNSVSSATPGLVLNSSDFNWTKISVGSLHSAAITNQGKLFTWGYNVFGACGTGFSGSGNESSPIQQIGNENWNMVSCGTNYTLLIKSDGTLWSMGDNAQKQCGVSNTMPLVPTQVGTDTNWKQVTANSTLSMGIKTDGTLWTWGTGYLGNGMGTSTANTPTQVGTDTDWDTIADVGSFAIKTNGTLWGWGSNNQGSLGNGNSTISLSLIQIGTDTDWSQVSRFSENTIALKNNNTLWTWGGNLYGQLGNGTNTMSGTPTQIGTATNWIAVKAGEFFGVALQSNGELYSFGINTHGQLGTGNTVNANTPTLVNCTPLNTQDFSANIIAIYPNPTTGIVQINLASNAITIKKITVTDLTGKIILEQNDNFFEINLSGFENGIYLLNIISLEKNYTHKIVKK